MMGVDMGAQIRYSGKLTEPALLQFPEIPKAKRTLSTNLPVRVFKLGHEVRKIML